MNNESSFLTVVRKTINAIFSLGDGPASSLPSEAGNPGIHMANFAILDHGEALLAGSGAGDPFLPCSTKIA